MWETKITSLSIFSAVTNQDLHSDSFFVFFLTMCMISGTTVFKTLKKLSVGPVGLEPTTTRLKADCSTDWAMNPFFSLDMFYSPSESNRYPINWEQSLSLSCLPIPPDELRAMGFEPISSAWKADNLALDLCPHETHVFLAYTLYTFLHFPWK